MLADLRPNARAIAEVRSLFGDATTALEGVGEVAPEWYSSHVLAPAFAVSEHQFCDLDAQVPLRHELENQLAALLAGHGMDHLDIAQVRSRDRVATQTVSRKLFERDYAGEREARSVVEV